MTVEEFDQNDRIDMVDARRIIEIVTTLAKSCAFNHAEVIREAIKALEEVQQYRTIGTPEECREAMEKQAEKKVLHNEKAKRYFCPTCKRKCNYMHSLYCSGCGQKLDWSDEE